MYTRNTRLSLHPQAADAQIALLKHKQTLAEDAEVGRAMALLLSAFFLAVTLLGLAMALAELGLPGYACWALSGWAVFMLRILTCER